MDSVREQLSKIFPGLPTSNVVASHRFMRASDYLGQRKATISFFGGTNALKSHMFIRGNWKVSPLDLLLLRNVVLLGVGWRQYQGAVDLPSRLFFNTALSKRFIHSVRDEHALKLLGSCIKNVVNTSCVTLWNMSPSACAMVPVKKARKVIYATTYYAPHVSDLAIFNYLKTVYEEVYFWVQQAPDAGYANDIGMTGYTPIEQSVAAYNRILETEDVDFVGARLHGGIRALQKGRRALILSVDNRAKEIARDTGLSVMERDDLSAIKEWVESPRPFTLRLPTEAIDTWRGQFRSGL